MVDTISQAAVPKFMTVRLDPPSSTTLPPLAAAPVTQRISCVNSQQVCAHEKGRDVDVRLRRSCRLEQMRGSCGPRVAAVGRHCPSFLGACIKGFASCTPSSYW
jgi:hypothetical protein